MSKSKLEYKPEMNSDSGLELELEKIKVKIKLDILDSDIK